MDINLHLTLETPKPFKAIKETQQKICAKSRQKRIEVLYRMLEREVKHTDQILTLI